MNSFTSLFYIAFFKRDIEGCIGTDSDGNTSKSFDYTCGNELTIQLRSIFIVAFLKNFFEIVIPWLKQKVKQWKKSRLYVV